jgi:hypothetical protein
VTIAHPGAALCMFNGGLTPAIEWPGIPCCRQHVAEAMEANIPALIKPPPSWFAAPSTELQ